MDYKKLSVSNFLKETKAGNSDLVDFYAKLSEEIKNLDKKFNFFTILNKPNITQIKNKNGKLHSLPVSVKDCICVKGLQSSAGSKILKGYMPPFDATAVLNVKSEGGLVIGKTNQDEFGFGTFSTNSGFAVPKNPLDPTRSCGGSSGGAAGLTRALDFPHIALGESTGGSISCPASFCGVAGLTPTYGLVSRYGLIDYANSLDKIGPIGKTVEDVALMLSAIAGHDPKDSTSIQKEKEDYTRYLDKKEKLKIGVPKEYFSGVNDKITKNIWNGIKLLENLGYKYEEISLPMTDYVIASYYIIATAEASTNLAKFAGMRYGMSEQIEGSFNEYFSQVRTKYFGEEAKRRILLGTYTRMAGYRDQYYLKAMKVRTLIIQEFKKAFKKYDILIAPTMPVVAPKFSEIEKLTPIENYMMDILTVAPNLAGIPMLSVPCGSINGMPVGLHIMGDHLQEGKVLKAGYDLDKLRKQL